MSDPISNAQSFDHPLDLIAAQYVLGVLSSSARLRVEARMLQDDGIREAVHAWERRLNPLASTLPTVNVPTEIWQRICAQLDRQIIDDPVVHSASTATPTVPQSTRANVSTIATNDSRWRPLAWMSSAIAAGLLLFIVLRPNTLPPTPAQITAPLQATAIRDLAVLSQGDQPAWIVRQQDNQLIVSNLNAAAVPSEHDLELWSIQGDNPPRSLGLIRVKDGQAILPNIPSELISANATLAISLEPLNGSPTGAPTGDVLYVGKVVATQG
jgi:anti-sigma-K factor RskA